MKIKPAPLQPDAVPFKLPGVMVRATQHGWVVQKLPAKENGRFSPLVKQFRTRFGIAGRMASNPNSLDMRTAHFFAQGTEQVPRDILTTAALGRYFEIVNPDGTTWGHVEGAVYTPPISPVEPPPISGFDMWLDASQDVTTEGGVVNPWIDRSPSALNLPATGTSSPTGTLAFSPSGLPAVAYTGTGSHEVDYPIRPQPFTRFWVGSTTQSFGAINFSGATSDSRAFIGANLAGTDRCTIRSPDAVLAFGRYPFAFAIRAVVFNGASSMRRLNNIETGPSNFGSNGRGGIAVMQDAAGTRFTQGHMCEIIDWPFALDVTQRNTMTDWLAAKWGVTL